jgi:DNA-binding response OmpR family regulator
VSGTQSESGRESGPYSKFSHVWGWDPSSFDVVVSDVFLDGRTGLELARELRAAGMRTPLVALSGADQSLMGAAARAAGFDLYCRMPCTPCELADVISSLLARCRETMAAATQTYVAAQEVVRQARANLEQIRREHAERQGPR